MVLVPPWPVLLAPLPYSTQIDPSVPRVIESGLDDPLGATANRGGPEDLDTAISGQSRLTAA